MIIRLPYQRCNNRPLEEKRREKKERKKEKMKEITPRIEQKRIQGYSKVKKTINVFKTFSIFFPFAFCSWIDNSMVVVAGQHFFPFFLFLFIRTVPCSQCHLSQCKPPEAKPRIPPHPDCVYFPIHSHRTEI